MFCNAARNWDIRSVFCFAVAALLFSPLAPCFYLPLLLLIIPFSPSYPLLHPTLPPLLHSTFPPATLPFFVLPSLLLPSSSSSYPPSSSAYPPSSSAYPPSSYPSLPHPPTPFPHPTIPLPTLPFLILPLLHPLPSTISSYPPTLYPPLLQN